MNDSKRGTEWGIADTDPAEPGLGDIFIQLRRIADALDAQNPHCEEKRDGLLCFLLPRHVGYHVTADGRTHWLEDE